MSKANERTFQDEIIDSLVANGWLLGDPQKYNRELALYEEDLIGFVKDSQPKMWEKYVKYNPIETEKRLISHVAKQLNKTNPNTTDKELRSFGTLGVLRKGIKDAAHNFSLCQFKPEHDLNPDTLTRYEQNRLRVVPELVYSPYATEEHYKATSNKAKAYRIDLVLFVNGLPIATLELKSEFKQSVERAIKQYKTTRLPKDSTTKKAEPLLTFKRGALVHLAVSQYEVYMCTRLAGNDSRFLPFNKGTKDGGQGNDIPEDKNRYATDYLWNEILLPDNILSILADFVHLEIKEEEDARGLKYKKEALIFPRYHQWDVVSKLIGAVCTEGVGQKYLIQHSAGSGKSNSIAWTAHQLSALHRADGEKMFNSVIIVTDRTVLDSQLQDTVSQFTDVDGVVAKINHKTGLGSKSEKLAKALEAKQPIIIVTIQTFPFVVDCIEKSDDLKLCRFAVIADEAHSSQSGSTAKQMKELLKSDTEDDHLDENKLDDEDIVNEFASVGGNNLSFFAFTATPKDKTIQLFGRCDDLTMPPSKTNLPKPFHVYTMRQAIEEGFILDVLKNYITYNTAYKLAQKSAALDKEVDSKKTKTKLNRWVRLHPHNIAQKVVVIVEHFRQNVKDCLHGQAKAMVVTSSRKEAVRYKLALDKYVSEQGYTDVVALVAFSGEVVDNDNSYTERNMNPLLKGRDMRDAFDTEEFQLMLVADKFQTGFDQPKLCAMYVDKKLGGVDCVQTLSRLNRCYPGKEDSGTFILDFFNDAEDILDSFKPYYLTAELADVSDPNLTYDLFDKLNSAEIFLWNEVEQFYEAFINPSKSAAAISNICKPAVDRWSNRYKEIHKKHEEAKEMFERTKKLGDAVLIANAENSMKELKKELNALIVFKKDLGSFSRFYEFMSQIVNYEDIKLKQLSLYARHLAPMLREEVIDDEDIDLSSVVLTHYRLSKIREQNLKLEENCAEYKITPGNDLGSGVGRDKKEDFISAILEKLNALFDSDKLTDADLINYAQTLYDKIKENDKVMDQFKNNTPEQAMLGDFTVAFDSAVMDSSEVHQNLMMQVLSNTKKSEAMKKIIFQMWSNEFKSKHNRL